MNPVSQFLVIIATLLLLGALGEFIFRKTGIPNVIWLVIRKENGRRRQVDHPGRCLYIADLVYAVEYY